MSGLAVMLAPWLAAIPAAPDRALAADLGGSCCGDLEERIAELEATTARKGNRKVTLVVSGYVSKEITVWDDGGERNAYIHDLGPTQTSHFKLNGQATIAPGFTAGYLLRIQSLSGDPFGREGTRAMSQFSDGLDRGFNVQMSYWYLQSKELGKISVGKQANAAKSAAMFTDQSGTQIFDNSTFLSGFPQFVIRSRGDLTPAGLTWGQLAFCYTQAVPLGGDCNGIVMEAVRYDSPVFAGFSLAASWGEDDHWEAAVRYAGELAGFKVLAGAGYAETTDENATGPTISADVDSQVFQAGFYVQHLATGLFLHTAYGQEDNNETLLLNGRTTKDGEHWYVKAGLRRKLMPLGATIVYGTYAEYDDQLGPAALALGAESSTLTRFGGGLAQEIDAAAMTVYLKVQHTEADIAGAALPPAVSDLEDADFVSFGGMISF
ncbi:MAG: porin [Hyphomicrobium sp.]